MASSREAPISQNDRLTAQYVVDSNVDGDVLGQQEGEDDGATGRVRTRDA